MRRRRCRTTEDISFSLSICQTSTQQATDVIITLNQEGSKNLSFCPQCHTHQGNLSSKVWDWRLPSVDLIAFLLVDWLIDRPLWSCAYGSENCPEEWSNSGQQRQLQIAKECCSDCHTRNQLCCPKEEVFCCPRRQWSECYDCNLMRGTGNKEILLPPRRIGIPGN